MRLAQLGEFGFIERIRRQTEDGVGVRLGIGDDCAATAVAPGELLLTSTDLLIEGVHFLRSWSDMHLLGRKSVAVNVSDIAAMGGSPRHLFLGLAIPPEMPVEELDAFVAGFLEAATEYGAVLAGGDTCRSPGPFTVSVTVHGAIPERELVRRQGARPGDAVYLSGTVGDSALALQMLQAGEQPDAFLAARHHDPAARAELGRALAVAGIPSSMIDLSDGLLADLGHILAASDAGARIDEPALPLSEPFRRALAQAPELLEAALSGGEDYELLFTVPPEREAELRQLAVPVTKIGEITTPDNGLRLRDQHGRLRQPGRPGFDHFG